jgi:hypothetical protein
MICSQTALPCGIKETNDWAAQMQQVDRHGIRFFSVMLFQLPQQRAVEALETTEKKKRGDHSTKWWPQLTENWWP